MLKSLAAQVDHLHKLGYTKQMDELDPTSEMKVSFQAELPAPPLPHRPVPPPSRPASRPRTASRARAAAMAAAPESPRHVLVRTSSPPPCGHRKGKARPPRRAEPEVEGWAQPWRFGSISRPEAERQWGEWIQALLTFPVELGKVDPTRAAGSGGGGSPRLELQQRIAHVVKQAAMAHVPQHRIDTLDTTPAEEVLSLLSSAPGGKAELATLWERLGLSRLVGECVLQVRPAPLPQACCQIPQPRTSVTKFRYWASRYRSLGGDTPPWCNAATHPPFARAWRAQTFHENVKAPKFCRRCSKTSRSSSPVNRLSRPGLGASS
eukprot:SAG11_NODE_5403_length_1571_cov_1.039402_1_plen_321_part_00